MQSDHQGNYGIGAQAAKRMQLRIGEGDSCTQVTFSAGVERFIGRYPRVDGISADGALLTFSAISA